MCVFLPCPRVCRCWRCVCWSPPRTVWTTQASPRRTPHHLYSELQWPCCTQTHTRTVSSSLLQWCLQGTPEFCFITSNSLLIDHMTLHRSPAVLHSLHGILHLKHSTVRREGGGWQVILQDTHAHTHTQNVRRTWTWGRECVCYECVTECRLLVSWQAQTENLNRVSAPLCLFRC